MKTYRNLLTITITIVFLSIHGAHARTWTSSDGSRTFDGELQSYDGAAGTVTVTLASGQTLTFLESKLSAIDIAFLKEQAKKAVPKAPGELTDPDGKEADMSKPVKVFILMGQSNMLGFGKIAGADKNGTLEHATQNENLYPFLVDDSGNWTERKDVRNVRVMVGRGGMQVFNNEWMTIKGKAIGPEIGIGHHIGNLLDEPVMVLKSCIGNRSLGWDLLPPGSPQFEKDGKVYAGYKESPLSWDKGTEPQAIGWYAGKQYDDDIANAKKVLEDLSTYYPGAQSYEVAGFLWWQGDKDRYNEAHAARYEQNLVQLIKQLRKEFEAPNAKFVCATLGQTKKDAAGNEGAIINGQMAVDGESGKYSEFKGNVATVYSNPLSQGGASNGHYSGNAKTYMDIGLAMGEAMVKLLLNN